MDNRTTKGPSPKGVRDRRYAIRYPFAADVELIDMETGSQATGVTSDISFGGCFICTTNPPPVKTRLPISPSPQGQIVTAPPAFRSFNPPTALSPPSLHS